MAAILVEQTYQKLMDMIIQKQFKPGDRLPSEKNLCETYEVSRNTLRAALNKLDALGLTTTTQGGGTYVKQVDSEVYLNFFVPALLTHNPDLLEIMHFRKGIEVEAARLAAQNATNEDLEELSVMLENCQASLQEIQQFAAANAEFHSTIAKASHNKMFLKMMDIIRTMLLPEFKNFLSAQGEDIDSMFYHTMILQCIRNHKPDEAAFFMDRHLELVINRMKNYVEK